MATQAANMGNTDREKLQPTELAISNAPFAVCMTDREMRYIAASEKWFQEFQGNPENFIGKSHYDIFPNVPESRKAIHRECLAGASKNGEDKFIDSNGLFRWIQWEIKPWYASGEIGGLLMYTEDISERKKMEDLLRETSSVAKIGGWEVDLADGSILWTSGMYEIHQVNEDFKPSIETAIAFFKEGGSRDTIHKLIDAALKDGSPCDEELVLVTSKGKEIWVEVKGKAEMLNGNCIRLVGTYQDISERKRAQTVNQALLERLSLATKASGIGIWDYYVNSKEMVWDGQMYRLYGIQKGENQNLYELWINSTHPDDRARRQEGIEKALKGEKEYNIQFRMVRPNGEVRHLRALATVVRDSRGNAVRMTGTNWDMTDILQSEEKLRESEESFRGAFANSATGMALVDLDGKWLKVNESLCKSLGYTEEELLGLTFQELTHPDDLEADLRLLKELIRKKRESYQIEKRYFHKNGDIIWILLSVSMVTAKDGKPMYFVSQIIDITERKNSESALNQTLAQLQGILDSTSQVSIIGTDVHGTIVTFNKGAENLLGYSASEMIGKQTPAIIHKAEEVEKVSKELSEEFKKEISGFDTFVYKARLGKFDSREWTYVKKDGSNFPVQLVITSIKNADGVLTGFIGVAIDISKIKQVEKEMQSLVSVTSEQNDRLLNFAHIVSHNLRSHSGNIAMLLQFLENEENPTEREELFSHLKTASQQLTETISHLNEVVALTTNILEKAEKINLKKAVEGALNNVNALVREHGVEIENKASEKLFIKGVPAYVQSILLNFITNAIKYRSEDRKPRIKINTQREGTHVLVAIADNGIGIDLEQHGHKLFGMYKTFHGNKDARGIGLFITKNQIEAMGGKVEVESEPGKGSTFKIYFNEYH